ncbi:MAG: DUF11 domain-containing protein [Phycisphaerales bacterium]|nr:DUF11 domain-containing protein [Phycisphaerales bacterium]
MIRGLEQKSHRGVLGILVATVLLGSALPCLAQPFVNGQNWTSVAVGGGSLQFNTDGDAALESYPIIPPVLANNAVNVQFMRSPDASVVYARAFGSALTGVCSPTEGQVYMFDVVQDNDSGGHLETIYNGGLCLNGGLPDHEGLYEVPGQSQHIAYFVEAKSTPSSTRQFVHWIDLNDTDSLGSTELNVDVDGVFFKFQPDGESAFVKHGLLVQPMAADYTLIDLCAAPRLGQAITSAVGGSLFGLGVGDPTIELVEDPPASGSFLARILHPDIGATGQLDVPLTPCNGPVTGSCCDGGSCSVTDAASCSGSFTPGGTCNPDPCVVPTEACCGFSTCSEETPADCLALGGISQGPGSDCASAACFESCCLAGNPTCFFVRPDICTNANGTPGGPGSDCTSTVCPAPVLDIIKSCPPQVNEGETYTCTITFENSGTEDAQNVTINETLPTGATFISASNSPGGQPATLVNGTTVRWDIGTLSQQTFNQQVTFNLKANCGTSQINNTSYHIISSPGVPVFGPAQSTSVNTGSTAPIDISVTSVDVNGGLFREGDIVEHTFTLTNTAAVMRPDVRLRGEFGGDIGTGFFSDFDSVVDAAGGTVVVSTFNDRFNWNGDIGPNATINVVVRTRVDACVNSAFNREVLNSDRPITVRNACNVLVGSTSTLDEFTLFRPLSVNLSSPDLGPSVVRPIVAPGSVVQVARAGDLLRYDLEITNADSVAYSGVLVTVVVPGTMIVNDPPFVGPQPVGTSYDAPTRTISFLGTVPANSTIVVSWEGTIDLDACSVQYNVLGATGVCPQGLSNFRGNLTVYTLPELPANPHLLGVDNFQGIYTFTPGVDTQSQDLLCLHGEIYTGIAQRDNDEIWVSGLPSFSLKPDTLELEIYAGQFFVGTLGFAQSAIPTGIAYDQNDDTVIFSGAGVTGGRVVRYDPDTRIANLIVEDPAIQNGRCFVDLEGHIVVRGNSALFRIDPADPMNFLQTDYSTLPEDVPPSATASFTSIQHATLDVDGDYLTMVQTAWIVGPTVFERYWMGRVERTTGAFSILLEDISTLGVAQPTARTLGAAVSPEGDYFFAQQTNPDVLYRMTRGCGVSAAFEGFAHLTDALNFVSFIDLLYSDPITSAGPLPTSVMGDFDGNCLVELADHVSFVDCCDGPDQPPAPTPPIDPQQCLDAFDFDSSGTIDLRDWQSLSKLIAAP